MEHRAGLQHSRAGGSLPHKCRKLGDATSVDWWGTLQWTVGEEQDLQELAKRGSSPGRGSGEISGVSCVENVVKCPKNAYYCRSGEVEALRKPERCYERETKKPDMTRVGRVEGTIVTDIILDTGCDRTLVRRELVPAEKAVGSEVPIRCAHGDTHMYPIAQLDIELGGSTFTVEAAVTDHLPVSVLLGKDGPELMQLLKRADQEAGARGGTSRGAKEAGRSAAKAS